MHPADEKGAPHPGTVTVWNEQCTLSAGIVLHQTSFTDAVQQCLIGVEGDAARVAELFGLFDDFSPMFEIVEPKPEP